MNALTLADLRTFLRAQPWAVEATVSRHGAPQAAVIGIAVTDSLEVIFDTLAAAHKHRNLCVNAQIALVVGWDSGCTVQLTGTCDQPTATELDRLKKVYFTRFPDGREREGLSNIAYWRVRPRAIRYSDFNSEPATIVEWNATDIARWIATGAKKLRAESSKRIKHGTDCSS